MIMEGWNIMPFDDSSPTRRSVLKATGAVFGAAAASGLGTAAASECYVLKYDYKTYRNCPPVSDPSGPIVEAGSQAFSGCTDRYGNEYLYAIGNSGAGYVPKSATEPC